MTAYEITMKHGSVPEGLGSLIEEKIARLEKYLKESSRIEFILEEDHDRFRCEAIVHDRRPGTNIVVHDTADQIRSSLDGVLEKMRTVLVKRKDRRKDHHRGHGLGEQLASSTPPESDEDEPSYEDIVKQEIKGE